MARVVRGFEETDPSRMAARGGSQGGALSIACASLDPSIARCVSAFPFLSDYKRIWEMDLLKETSTAAVHNPESNMNNAVGVAPILKMMAKGVEVGLGTDAMTSNMGKEVQLANILQHLGEMDPRVAFCESCQLLLENNPRIASRFFGLEIGSLEPGAAADVIVVDYDPPTPMNEGNFLGHFLFGVCESPVKTTVVDGKILMRDRELVGIDEERITARSRELAAEFLKRF